MNKSEFLGTYMILTITVVSCQAVAVSIGASPGVVTFNNMLRDGYAEKTITITTNSAGNITAHYELMGEIAEWLEIEPNSSRFTFSGGSPKKLKIIALPPEDTANGNYNGFVRVVTDRLGSPSGGVGSAVRTAIMIRTSIGVTDTEIIKCRIGGLIFNDLELGFPLEFFATVLNEGNTRLRPMAIIDIWDQLQENLVHTEELTGEEILPTVHETLRYELTDNLPLGQYWANIAFPECDSNQLLTFSVVEPGAIIDKGTLIYVKSKTWVFVNETVAVDALFRNNGPRSVTARFKGAVKLGDEIVRLLESAEFRVEPNEETELTVYYTPPEPGRYEVSGRVIYNNKLTFEKGTVLNANYRVIGKYYAKLKILPLVIYIIILISILFLIFRIRKKRREKGLRI